MPTLGRTGTENRMDRPLFDRSFGERSRQQAGIVANAIEVCAVGPPLFGPQSSKFRLGGDQLPDEAGDREDVSP